MPRCRILGAWLDTVCTCEGCFGWRRLPLSCRRSSRHNRSSASSNTLQLRKPLIIRSCRSVACLPERARSLQRAVLTLPTRRVAAASRTCGAIAGAHHSLEACYASKSAKEVQGRHTTRVLCVPSSPSCRTEKCKLCPDPIAPSFLPLVACDQLRRCASRSHAAACGFQAARAAGPDARLCGRSGCSRGRVAIHAVRLSFRPGAEHERRARSAA